MYNRMVVDGILVGVTDTHFVTLVDGSTCLWSKMYYRLPAMMV
jgi:hypothetical protein